MPAARQRQQPAPTPMPAIVATAEGVLPAAWCSRCAWHQECHDAIELGRTHAGEHPGHTVTADEVLRHTFRAVLNDVL